MKKFILFLVLVLIPDVCFSAPSGIGGPTTITHGGTATFTGADFGTKSQAAPVVWDNGSGSDPLNLWDGAWPDSSADASYRIDYRVPAEGLPHNRVSACITGAHYTNDASNLGRNVMVWKNLTTSLPDYVYLSFYARLSDNFDSGDNFKYFDFSCGSGVPYTVDTPAWNNWYIEYVGGVSGDHHCNDDGGTLFHQPGAFRDYLWNSWYHGAKQVDPRVGWTKIEITLYLTSGNDGWYDIYENGVHIIDLAEQGTGAHTYNGPTDAYEGIDRTISVGGYSREHYTYNWRYYSDIYLDYALNRVILGNASTYNACTIREPQIPTAWSDNSVTVGVNLGAMADDTSAWIYIVNELGEVNNTGYAVTTGTGGATTTCYYDPDDDGYGSDSVPPETGVETCSLNYYESDDLTATSGDCNDSDAAINPGATEICGNGVDEDCDGTAQACSVSANVKGVYSSGCIMR